MGLAGGNKSFANNYSVVGPVIWRSAALILLLLLTTAEILAEDNTPESPVAENEETATGTDDEDALLDRHKRQVDSQVRRASLWVDSFFADQNYEAEVSTSQLRIRPELHYRNEQGAEARLKVSLKLSLPNVDRRISLVVGSENTDDDFGDPVDDPGDDSIIGLQFFGKQRNNWHSSMSVGFKFNKFAMLVGPRVRYYKTIGDASSYRFTQSLRWQTNSYWQVNSRLDLNHAFNDRFFFRQTFDGRWRGEDSDEDGYRTQVSSILTQHLKNAAGLQYEFSTVVHTRPDTHIDRYTLSMRYRKRSSRDWLYYEIAPEVSFEDEFDYKANPGIRLRVEFFYGANPDSIFYKRELEDTDNFRW